MKFVDQFVIPHVTAPLWLRKNGVQPFLAEYSETQYWPAERLQQLQFARLRHLLQFAYDNCDFYRARFDQAGFNPRDVRSAEELKQLPPLTKDDIRHNFDALKPRNLDPKSYFVNFTGGSTGSPLQFLVSHERMNSRKASTLRHDRWAGWNFGMPIGYIWGYPPDVPPATLRQRLYDSLFYRTVYLDTFDVKPEKVEAFVLWLQQEWGVVFIAYARSLLWFCQHLEEKGIRGLRVKSAIAAAESITPEERGFIERVLGCPVFERYGCREFSVLASECEAHQGLHLCSETLLLEFVQDGREVAPGQPGEILVTDLLNTAMPMIRYRIGDVGTRLEGACPCGRGLPRMGMVAGRITDFIHTPEGRWISGVAINTYLISKIPGVRQAQIRQERCEEMRILMVPEDGGREAALQFLRAQVPQLFGTAIQYKVEWVESIPREASGKSRVTVSACATKHGIRM